MFPLPHFLSSYRDESDFFAYFAKFLRRILVKFQIFAGDRMHESQRTGVKHLRLYTVNGLLWTVDRITQQRMMNMRHMHTDLVSASRLQAAFDQGETLCVI